jgi:uncharacterized membrane protein YgcG
MFVPFLLIHCLLDFFFTRGLGFLKYQVIEMGRKSRRSQAASNRLLNSVHQENGDFGFSRQDSESSNSSSSNSSSSSGSGSSARYSALQ